MSLHRRIARTSAALIVALAAGASPAAAQNRGEPGDERIIGGTTAPAGSWPSIARLQARYAEDGKTFTSSCGGTVVAPHWVLTAAHCTFGKVVALTADQITVVTGRHDLTATGTGESIAVSEIRRHPSYNHGGSLGYDLALLRLAAATAAAPMQMATQAAVNTYSSPPDVPNTAGWGWTIPGNDASDTTALRQAYVPLRENDDCAAALAGTAPFDSSIMVCAGAAQVNGTTTCHGDSGGPLVVQAGSPARPVLWGVVNWGAPDCDRGISAFARVAAFTGFLEPVFAEVAPAVAAPPPPVAQPPVAPPPAAPPPAAPLAVPKPASDTRAPRLDRFVIPAIVRVRGGRPRTAIRIRLRSDERATIRVHLQRRARGRYVPLPRHYRVSVRRGTSRMTLPRTMWRLTSGIHRLRFQVTDAAGNSRSYRATISVRRG